MSFINPLFLAALGTALLPVLYHLVRRMRAQKVEFSSLMFLRATPEELVRKRRLRDWLLLLLRSLMFALLALAFARPFLPDDQIPFTAEAENQSTVILLDNSYSMEYDDIFDTARGEAIERIDNASTGDEFAVVMFSDNTRQLTSLETDLSIHRTALQQAAEVSYRPTDFYNPLHLAEELLQDARHPDRRIMIISDFQNSGWTSAMNNWKLDSEIELVPVNVGPPDPHNTYVENVELIQERRGTQVMVQYGARLGQQTNQPSEPQTVTLSIDERVVGERTVPTASDQGLTFQEIASDPGYFQGTITTSSSDPLSIDDRYYFTYTIDPQPSLLCIDGAISEQRSDAFFLEQVFDVGEESMFQFSSGGPSRLNTETLGQYDVIFLANLSQLGEGQIDRLQTYVENGGSIILSFGNETEISSLSRALEQLDVGTLESSEAFSHSQSREMIIGEVDLQHPIFDVFAETGNQTIFRSKFRRYVRLDPNRTAEVLGTYSSGDPFLVERTRGNGKILVYTSSFNTAWTNFPIHDTYVPLLYQMAAYGAREAQQQYIYEVGDQVPLMGGSDDTWEVRAPDNTLQSVTIGSSGKGFFSRTDVPGHYLAENGNEQFRFSVNLNTRESDLASRDEEETYAAIVPSTREQSPGAAQEAGVTVAEDEQRQKLWRTILLIVLALFLIETILANRKLGSHHRNK